MFGQFGLGPRARLRGRKHSEGSDPGAWVSGLDWAPGASDPDRTFGPALRWFVRLVRYVSGLASCLAKGSDGGAGFFFFFEASLSVDLFRRV